MAKFKVVFAESAPVDGPVVFLFPIERRWNDFTFNFRAVARFQAKDRKTLTVPMFVMPIDLTGIAKTFGEWFDKLTNQQRQSPSDSSFITLPGDPGAYAQMREWSDGESEYLAIVEALQDITWLTKAQGLRLGLAARSDEFRLGVLRSGAAYRAFRLGFDGPLSSRPTLSDARVDFVFHSELDGQRFELPVCFKDNPFFEDRVHCLVGKNGVGKSRLLSTLLLDLASNKAGEKQGEQALPDFNRVLVYTTEAEPQFPTDIALENFDYRHFSLTQRHADDTHEVYIGRMLVDLLREREDAESPLRYDAFKYSVTSLIPWEALCLPLIEKIDDGLSFVDKEGLAWAFYSHLEYVGEQRRLTISGQVDPDREVAFFKGGELIRLSSGQRTFLRFALHFVSFVSVGTLVIVDEPETHLHPNLVSEFMLLLNRMIARYKSIALVATHSIYVVREVPTYCNHLLERDDDGHLSVDSVYLPTLGASPTSLSMAIFGDATANRVTRSIARKIASDGRSIVELIPVLESVVSSEMLMEIRALIEDQNATS